MKKLKLTIESCLVEGSVSVRIWDESVEEAFVSRSRINSAIRDFAVFAATSNLYVLPGSNVVVRWTLCADNDADSEHIEGDVTFVATKEACGRNLRMVDYRWSLIVSEQIR